ncbi:hypothetical protein GCM10012275_24340 [Longimycelium tulufanense]|uniref:Uncharacterized protein n=1 Tax=Longimycelium tulufanense TaxID=907463 RepID=A0A8J3C7Z0_9PSEU|nr:hypothetical protein [Longimycelium tulufanense]GGM52495.1 hypothetical protein GCM10012275_24340 [Longimycelium tulufanense]
MTWLFGQVWLWSALAFLAGALITWLLFARPARQRLAELDAERGAAAASAEIPEGPAFAAQPTSVEPVWSEVPPERREQLESVPEVPHEPELPAQPATAGFAAEEFKGPEFAAEQFTAPPAEPARPAQEQRPEPARPAAEPAPPVSAEEATSVIPQVRPEQEPPVPSRPAAEDPSSSIAAALGAPEQARPGESQPEGSPLMEDKEYAPRPTPRRINVRPLDTGSGLQPASSEWSVDRADTAEEGETPYELVEPWRGRRAGRTAGPAQPAEPVPADRGPSAPAELSQGGVSRSDRSGDWAAPEGDQRDRSHGEQPAHEVQAPPEPELESPEPVNEVIDNDAGEAESTGPVSAELIAQQDTRDAEGGESTVGQPGFRASGEFEEHTLTERELIDQELAEDELSARTGGEEREPRHALPEPDVTQDEDAPYHVAEETERAGEPLPPRVEPGTEPVGFQLPRPEPTTPPVRAPWERVGPVAGEASPLRRAVGEPAEPDLAGEPDTAERETAEYDAGQHGSDADRVADNVVGFEPPRETGERLGEELAEQIDRSAGAEQHETGGEPWERDVDRWESREEPWHGREEPSESREDSWRRRAEFPESLQEGRDGRGEPWDRGEQRWESGESAAGVGAPDEYAADEDLAREFLMNEEGAGEEPAMRGTAEPAGPAASSESAETVAEPGEPGGEPMGERPDIPSVEERVEQEEPGAPWRRPAQRRDGAAEHFPTASGEWSGQERATPPQGDPLSPLRDRPGYPTPSRAERPDPPAGQPRPAGPSGTGNGRPAAAAAVTPNGSPRPAESTSTGMPAASREPAEPAEPAEPTTSPTGADQQSGVDRQRSLFEPVVDPDSVAETGPASGAGFGAGSAPGARPASGAGSTPPAPASPSRPEAAGRPQAQGPVPPPTPPAAPPRPSTPQPAQSTPKPAAPQPSIPQRPAPPRPTSPQSRPRPAEPGTGAGAAPRPPQQAPQPTWPSSGPAIPADGLPGRPDVPSAPRSAAAEPVRGGYQQVMAAAATPFGPNSAPPNPDGSAPSPDFRVKASASSMLFHTPDSPYYARTRAEVWFRSTEDAERAGFRAWNQPR